MASQLLFEWQWQFRRWKDLLTCMWYGHDWRYWTFEEVEDSAYGRMVKECNRCGKID